MYYVLFETAETSFFNSIAMVYCENFARWLRDTYQYLKREDGRIYQDKLVVELTNRIENKMGHLQCIFFPSLEQCVNVSCKALHKCLLTRRQLKAIAEKLKEQKLMISENPSEIAQKDRLYFQSAFERCSKYVDDETVCVHIKHSTHQEYLNAYAEFINRQFGAGHHFVYVRGADSSDYDYFSRSIAGMAPCDAFQAVYSAFVAR
jgi:hypothetical protein